jgi:hypothetical protein
MESVKKNQKIKKLIDKKVIGYLIYHKKFYTKKI